jgi:hypothetical protein
MSTRHPLAFHLHETWSVPFTIADSAGEPVSLTGRSGSDIQWRLVSTLSPRTLVMKRTIGDGITIEADQVANKGKGLLRVTRLMQNNAGLILVPGYHYEHEFVADWVESVQVSGPFNVKRSLVGEFP